MKNLETLPVEADPAVLEHRRRQVAAKLDRLFRRAGQGVETRTLYEVIAKFRLERPS